MPTSTLGKSTSPSSLRCAGQAAAPLPLGRWRAGFTLVELLVVLCLLALFFGVAMPAAPLAGWRDPLRRAALDLAAFCAEARIKAVESGSDVFVIFDLGQQRYDMAVAGENGRRLAVPARLGHALPAGVRLAQVLGGSGQRALRRQMVRFSRKGYAPPARLLLLSAKGRKMSVLLDPFAFEAVVRPGYPVRAAAALAGEGAIP